jgi:hypothetical protein
MWMIRFAFAAKWGFLGFRGFRPAASSPANADPIMFDMASAPMPMPERHSSSRRDISPGYRRSRSMMAPSRRT